MYNDIVIIINNSFVSLQPQGSDIFGDQTNRDNVLLNLKAENAKVCNIYRQTMTYYVNAITTQ